MKTIMLRRILIALGYILVILIIVLGTFTLIADGIGYKLQHGHLVLRNGLVIFDSTPADAKITQDGQTVKRHTPYRTTIEAGNYHFEITKAGYRPWSKTVNILASEVTFVQYVLLVPTSPNIDSVAQPSTVSTAIVSRDHRHLAYIGDTTGALYTIDTSSRQQTEIYTPRTPAGATSPETLTSVEWSDDASHLIITATANTPTGPVTTTYIEAASGGDPTNLTAQYGFNFAGIKFAPGAWRQLYWISAEGLRRVDLDTQSVSAVLAPDVKQINVTTDHLFYVQQTSLGNSLSSLDRSDNKQLLIQALPQSPSYAIESATYRGHDYLAVVPASTHVATLYSDIYSSNLVARVISQAADDAAFSPDGHYLITWQKELANTYDLDRSSIGQNAVSYEFHLPQSATKLSWLDASHIVGAAGGRLYITEFDGGNTTDLGSATDAIQPIGVANAHAILFARASQSKVQITELELF